MTTKVIDVFNSLNLISDYNTNGLATNDRITVDSGGFLTIYNTTPSSNTVTGALVLQNGGLAINCLTNATTVSSGGALTVAGGASIQGDLIVGGSITYANSAEASNTFAYLTLTASDPSDNLANGALVTFGGISIQSTFNATAISSGGALTIGGGLAVAQDTFIGGVLNSTSISAATLNILTGTIGNLKVLNSNLENITVGSLYCSTSTLFNTALNVNGPLYINETSGNLSIIKNSGTGDVLQIQNLNNLGSSAIQFLNTSGNSSGYIGYSNINNNIYLNSETGIPIKFAAGNSSTPIILNAADNSMNITCTTISTDTSSGSLKIAGGVGIVGNLNVGGQLNINSPYTVNINNTQVSTNSTTGAMRLIGGLSISVIDTTNSNATSVTSGGGITVAGGVAISEDMQLGGILDIQSGAVNLNPVKLQSLQIFSNWVSGTTQSTIIGSGNEDRNALSFTPIRFTGWNDQNNPKMTINTNTIDIPIQLNAVNVRNTIGNLFTNNGNIGVGNVSPNAPLQFANTQENRKIVLYETANDNNQVYSFGVTNGSLRYQIDSTTSSHIFYAGTGSTSSNQLFTILGTGDTSVTGTANSNSVSTGNLYANTISTGTLVFSGELYNNGVSWTNTQWTSTANNSIYYGGSSGSVYVGIGTTSPAFTLDVRGNVNISEALTVNTLTTNDLMSTNIITNTVTLGGLTNEFSGSFTAANNITTPTDVTGLIFSSATVRSFSTIISVSLLRLSGGNLFAQYNIDGVQNDAGWQIDSNYIGDTTGIVFSINSGSGQLQYTSTNTINWNSTTFRYNATAISVGGNFYPSFSTSGNFGISGILSVQNTIDSTNSSNGSVVISGGVGISKNMSLGGILNMNSNSQTFAGTFNGNNGVISNTDITGLLYNSSNYRSFIIQMSVSVSATSSLYSQYTIEGIQRSSGWYIYTNYLGDSIDITFNITSTGQLQYSSSTTYSGWTSTTFNYQSTAILISGANSSITLATSGTQTITGGLVITNTSNATTVSSGALVVAGGAGITSDLRVGGNIYGLQQYAIIEDQKSNGTDGGSYTTGSFVSRTLNTIVADTIGITLSSNQITLSSGVYKFEIQAPGNSCDRTKAILINITDSTNALIGTSTMSNPSAATQTYSFINGILTISSSKTFAVQQYFQSSATSFTGGVATAAGITEVYTRVIITKLV
jgi:hypothetical protein